MTVEIKQYQEDFAIDKDKPVPPHSERGRGRPSRYPFELMEVGDSVFVECFGRDIGKTQAIILGAANSKYRNKEVKKYFTTRKEKSGVRFWRTK